MHKRALNYIYFEKDVNYALYQINSIKSTCPEGYSSGFFKAAWEIDGKDVGGAIQNMLLNLDQYHVVMSCRRLFLR